MKTCIKYFAAAFAAIFLALSAAGQETGVTTLHGHVLDSSNSESLFFTSVSLSGSTPMPTVSSPSRFRRIPRLTPR
jgi:hypothetical protein